MCHKFQDKLKEWTDNSQPDKSMKISCNTSLSCECVCLEQAHGQWFGATQLKSTALCVSCILFQSVLAYVCFFSF